MNRQTERVYKSGNRKAAAISIIVVALVLVAGAAFSWKRTQAAPSARAPAVYPQEIARVTFAAAGDVIPHQNVIQAAAAQEQLAASAPESSAATSSLSGAAPNAQQQSATTQPSSADHDGGWDFLFSHVAEAFRQADFGFVNLETPVAPVHSRGSKPFQFDAPLNLVKALQASGVKIVSIANNHVFDQGYAGFAETQQHLRELGLLYIGTGSDSETAWKPVIVEKNGIKIGWLGMTRWLNGNRNPEKASDPHVAFFPYPGESLGAPGADESEALAAIKAARAQCDFLIVSIHWGTEYAPAPLPKDIDIAHEFIEAGAGMVVGHHPHVLQPIETYQSHDQRNAVIFYSLGNFLSNQSRSYVGGLAPDKTGEPRDSLIAKFSVIKRDYGPAGVRVELGDVGIMPVWTENNSLQVRAGRAKTLFLGPVFIDREIPKLQARYDELNALGAQLTPEQKQEMVAVSDRLELLKHRRELILERTGDEYVIAPPSL